MNEASKKRAFITAIIDLLPDAILEHVAQTDWYSATFGGDQLVLTILLQGDGAKKHAQNFSNILPDYEFDMPKSFVADAAVTRIEELDDGVRLNIEALLIDD